VTAKLIRDEEAEANQEISAPRTLSADGALELLYDLSVFS
jgi:hypothetical protein